MVTDHLDFALYETKWRKQPRHGNNHLLISQDILLVVAPDTVENREHKTDVAGLTLVTSAFNQKHKKQR